MQRFLLRELDTSRPPNVYRLTNVTFGLKSPPFSNIQTMIDHLESQTEVYAIAVEEIKSNVFVDDILSGAQTTEAAARFAVNIKKAMASGGFPLKKIFF